MVRGRARVKPGPHGALGNVWGETRWQPKPAMSCCYPSNCPLWLGLLDTCGCRSSSWHSLCVLSPAAQNCCVTSVKTYKIKILLFCPVRNNRGSVCVVSSLGLCSVCAVLMETVLPVCSLFSLSPELRTFFHRPHYTYGEHMGLSCQLQLKALIRRTLHIFL